MVLASFSYGAGANIHSLNLARGVGFLLCLVGVNLIKRKSVRLPFKVLLTCYGVGILLSIEMYVLLAAVKSIPVALAVLIFFSYPILIAMYRWIKGVEPFTFRAMALMTLAFGGLIFVLLNAAVTPALAGVIFSICAAITMAVMLISSEASLNAYDNTVVLFHVLSMVSVIMLSISFFLVELAWPTGFIGWLGFTGSTFFYVSATFALFSAVSLIGPLRMAIIDNTAPVWAILFGYLILAESLSLLQMGGALVVVIAVMLLQIKPQTS